MPELKMSLRGTRPVPFGGGTVEKDWWQALAEKAQEVRANRPFPAIAPSAHFAVEMIFFMTPVNTPGGSELDNLAKPVLDTLFNARKQQPTGTLLGHHDTNVFKLFLEKRLVSTQAEEGVDVTITWE